MEITLLLHALQAGVVGLAALPTISPPNAPSFGAPIGHERAQKILAAAQAHAGDLGMPMAVAVVEPSGDLVSFVKMTGAPYSAINLAVKKAKVAARYRRPTKAFFDGLKDGHHFFLTFPDIVAVPGGDILVADGKLIGAIGVSGGNADQDVAVCNAGLGAIA